MLGVRLGITGSRNGLSPRQYEFGRGFLYGVYPTEMHHGACIGADAEMHFMVLRTHNLRNRIHVVVHPPVEKYSLAEGCLEESKWTAVLPPRPYLERDAAIVAHADRLLAFPDGPPRNRSGTWYTIRCALRKGIPVTVCFPDGAIDEHRADDGGT